MVGHWQGQGKRIVVYLDDGIGGERLFSDALRFSKSRHSDLVSAGFFFNEDKLIWTPSPAGV